MMHHKSIFRIGVFFLLFFVAQSAVYSVQTGEHDKNETRSISARFHDPTSSSIGDNSVSFQHETLKPNHVRGARIYDDFTIELDAVLTTANDLLSLATPIDPAMAPPSIQDGWRCSHCHGFNYKGGVYTFGDGRMPNLIESKQNRKITEEDIFNVLSFGINIFDGTTHINTHNYSIILTAQAKVDVADFIVNEIYDPSQYIRATTNESVPNHMPSMYIYKGAADPVATPDPLALRVNGVNFTCTECHGLDGRQVPGIDLYVLAWTDPFKWLHRANFGVPRSQSLYPDILAEDASVSPGVYEIMLVNSLQFGRSINTAQILEYVQTHFNP